VCNLAIHWL